MSAAIRDIFGKAVVEMLEDSIALEANKIASSKLYTGTQAIEAFGITRTCLKRIATTWLPGRSKPLYSAKAITEYLADKETKPRRTKS